jgi:hypothetical protein
MSKKKARDKPLQGAAWLRRHLERLEKAGPSVEERVLAGIGAWVDDYLRPPLWNEGYGDAVKSAARDILAATKSEDRALALNRFWGLLEWAAGRVGRQDHADEFGRNMRSHKPSRAIELRLAVERAMMACPNVKPTRGIDYAKQIRPNVLIELGLPEDTTGWPSAETIKCYVCDILDGRVPL